MNELFTDLHKEHLHKIREKIKSCYPEFSLIIDGSPFFANAECVKVRMFDKQYNIVELVVHLELFDTSLDSEDIANHIIVTIEDRMKADPKNWRAVMFDRASTNKAAISKISNRIGINPLAAYCVSHGTSTFSKKFD